MDRYMKYIESRPESAAVQCGTQLVEGKTYLVGYLSASKGDFKENENSLSEEVTSESVEETSGAKPVYHPVYHVDPNKIHHIDLVNLKLKSIKFPEKDKLVNVYYNLGYNDFYEMY